MERISPVQDLDALGEALSQVPDGRQLELSADSIPSLLFRNFLSALGMEAWVITKHQVTISETEVRLVGAVEVFGLGERVATMTFSDFGGMLDVGLEVPISAHGEDWILPGIDAESMTFADVSFEFTQSRSMHGGLAGGLVFRLKRHELEVPLVLESYGDGFLLHGGFDAENHVSIHTLLSLVGVDQALGRLPFHVDPLAEQLTLTALSMAYDVKKQEISSLAIGLSYSQAWNVLSSEWTIRGIEFYSQVASPLDRHSRVVDIYLEGELDIPEFDTQLDARVQFSPNVSVLARLKPGSSIDVKQLAETLLGASQGFPAVEVNDLRMRWAPDEASYAFQVTLTSDWVLDMGIDVVLRTTSLVITKTSLETIGHIHTALSLGPFELDASAEFLGIGQGWRFQGITEGNTELEIDTLIDWCAKAFGFEMPSLLTRVNLHRLATSFESGNGHFDFNCLAFMSLGETEVEIAVKVLVRRYGEAYIETLGGQLDFSGLQFDLTFSRNPADSLFIASYQDTTERALNVGALLQSVTSDAALVELGQGLNIQLEDALFAYDQGDGTADASRFLFVLDTDFAIDLSGLPLVGQLLPKDQTLRLMLSPLVASRAFSREDVAALRALAADGGTPLPDRNIEKGLDLSVTLRVGDQPIELALPIGLDTGSGQLADTTAADPTGGSNGTGDGTAPTLGGGGPGRGDIQWFNLQKSLGPVHFQRIGMTYGEGRLAFLLDGSLTAAGLNLALYGLRASSTLDRLAPEFGLDGLGIDYRNGSVEIGGALLRRPATAERPFDEYDGAAVVRASQWSLSAIGSYAYVDGHPSMFVYGTLDSALGGPAFFFVTGLALGFGYNRALVVPPIDGVKDFPLVVQASNPAQGAGPLSGEASQKINDMIRQLGDTVPPSPGQHFLAIGIKFTSFKLVDSFALLTASFGEHNEIDVLGLSTAIIPPPEAGRAVAPVAEVQMAFKATFRPEDGVVDVRAQLTPASFLLSRRCHLTGGFAFVTWFGERSGHAGDFVLTLGGYHPHYAVPTHYPRVPALGLNWRISDRLLLQGSAYFALTPSAIMAGGRFDATWRDGALRAWFRASADFLMAWKPYHYEASMHVRVGVRYTYHFLGTHHLSADAGAKLDIWGPEFSGKAQIEVSFITFTVRFGQSRQAKPPALTWHQFSDSFLPQPHDVCSLTPSAGLVRTLPAEPSTQAAERWVMQPKDLGIAIHSAIPVTHVAFGSGDAIEIHSLRWADEAGLRAITPFTHQDEGFSQAIRDDDSTMALGELGIGTMDIPSNPRDVQSTLTVSIRRGEQDIEASFGFVPRLKDVPAALWGSRGRPSLNGRSIIQDTLAGFEVVPATAHESGATQPVERRHLQFAVDGIDHAFDYEPDYVFQTEDTSSGRDVLEATLNHAEVAGARRTVLEAFGIQDPERLLRIQPSAASSLLADPVIGAPVA